jgi:hypothetical protein
VGWVAAVSPGMYRSGYLYTYAFAMIIGLLILLTWFVSPANLEEEKTMLSELPLLSLAIWFPILGGIAVLFVGDDSPGRAKALGPDGGDPERS